jgi:hypothetical protein
MEELESGLGPDPAKLLAEHPELADVLKPYLEELDLLHQAAQTGMGASAWLDDEVRGSERGRLGDFRLLREVGRGGMGVVYEAEQVSLNRRVALKVLPFAATLDARHLQRFKNEARAAAHLHHPHIVPVYGVGSDNGVHYYAMQFIEGQNLAQIVEQMRAGPAASLPTDPVGATVPQTRLSTCDHSMKRRFSARSPRSACRPRWPSSTPISSGSFIATSSRPICFSMAWHICGSRISVLPAVWRTRD